MSCCICRYCRVVAVSRAGGVKEWVVVWQLVGDGCTLGLFEAAGVYTHRTEGHAFAAHQTVVCYFIDFLFVVSTLEPYEVDR